MFFGKINVFNSLDIDSIVSIYNQEMVYENWFFFFKKGGFVDFYNVFGFLVEQLKFIGQLFIYYVMQYMNFVCCIFFVYNIMIMVEDIQVV